MVVDRYKQSWAVWAALLCMLTLMFGESESPINATVQKPLRIYCLGDSITQASVETYSWRYFLWKHLVQAKQSVDFVGTISNNYNGNPEWELVNGKKFDQDHDARWGWTANKVGDYLPTWLKSVDADVALIHIGTNDILLGQGAVSTLQDVERIIGQLRADNSKIIIFVAQIIPSESSRSFEPFNKGLTIKQKDWATKDSPVHIVDLFTGYDSDELNYDGLPPADAGEAFMAERWFKALKETGVIHTPVSETSK